MRSCPMTLGLRDCKYLALNNMWLNIPACGFVGLSKFKLNSIDAVYAVNEENQDEDERDLHPIL